MAERRQYRRSETGNCGVVDTHGLIVQIANSPRIGVVSDRVQRIARQIEKQMVVGLVDKSNRIAFRVMDRSLTRPHIAHGHLPPVLPIYSIGVITERQIDEKSICPLNRAAQSQYRVIASSLCDGHVSRT